MNNQKFYKVICDEINLILLLKKLTMLEERQEYGKIKRTIQGLDKPLTIDSYMMHVVRAFLCESDIFFNNLPKEEDEASIILRAVYSSIIEVYPPFDLEFVCADINNDGFLDELSHALAASVRNKTEKVGGTKPLRTLADINGLERYLRNNLIGQDEAVAGLVNSMKLVASGLYTTASFFFIGPTGVGKTELARLVGKKFSGNFWKVNCAEYAQAHEYAKLVGSPPGYIGHSEKSLMAEKAENSNTWVILFDEIEKAHPKFYDFLLSLLDDGTCTDNMGRVLDFTESIFIFTSNQGVSNIRVGKKLGFGQETVSVSGSQEEITASVKSKFPAEFMNRIDNYVFFNTLEQKHVKKIAMLSLKNLPIKKNKALLDFIVENGYSEEYGARNVKRFIKNEVATVIAQALLERKLPSKKGDLYTPKIDKGKVILTNLKDNNPQQDHAAD